MKTEIDTALELWQDGKESKAIELLEQSILSSSGEANTMVGQMYSCAERGSSDIKKDYKKARRHFEKGLELGDPESGVELGKLYYFGDGVKVNYSRSEEAWLKAYKLGDEMAAFELANFYYDDCQEKIIDAIRIYKELIERNEFVGSSCSKLSKIYGRGIGVDADPEKELEYLKNGAEVNHIHCCMNLALKHSKGDGVMKSKELALEYAEKAKTNDLFKEDVDFMIKRIESDWK